MGFLPTAAVRAFIRQGHDGAVTAFNKILAIGDYALGRVGIAAAPPQASR
jgi:hypothetical protein